MSITLPPDLPPEIQGFLLDLAGKPVEGVLTRVASAVGTALRGTPEAQALRAALTQAVAAFLACLDIPEDPEERRLWGDHIGSLLEPVVADERVQEALTDAILHQGRAEAVDVASFRDAWANRHGSGAEADLPWREGQSLETAVLALTRAFEREVEARGDLVLFLVAARLKGLLEVSARSGEIESLVRDMLRLTEQQVSLLGQLIRQFPDEQQRRAEAIRQIAVYHRALIRYCESLSYVSLPGTRGKRPPLSILYVRRRVKRRPEGGEAEAFTSPPPPAAGAGGGGRAPSPGRLPTAEAVRHHSHLALLGEPGAGKSTWLHHTIQRVAEGRGEEVGVAEPLLPVLVRLGPLSREKGSFPERLREVLENELGLSLPEDFFETWPAVAGSRGWLLACDGLDEVGDLEIRQRVVRWLEGLAEGPHRMLVTSRRAGYAAAALDEAQFATFELEPFTPGEAETFASRWFGAFLPPEEAEAKADGLLQEVHTRGLRGLLANPLLLTVMAVVYHEQGTLPRHRKELYEEFVRVLWEEAKRRGVKAALKARGLDEQSTTQLVLLTPALFPVVALTAHRERTTDEKRLAEAVAPLLMEEIGLGCRIARQVARGWLRVVGRWSGVLVARGGGYEFLHPTFREYLAARALAETYVGDPEELWAELKPHLLDDEWAEVIPLALAHLEDATFLLEQLLEANAQDEGRERPLFRAAAALAEGAEAGEAARHRVVDGLEYLARTRDWLGWGEASASDALAALAEGAEAGEAARHRVVDGLEYLARTRDWLGWGEATASDALAALGRMEGEPYAAQRLLALARDEGVDTWVRWAAVSALGELGRADDLLTLTRDEGVHMQVRMEAISALGELSRADELLGLARDEGVEAWVRLDAASALGELGWADELLGLARDEGVEAWVRGEAASALGELGRADELLGLARDEGVDARVRREAASALGELGRVDEAASILLALARDEGVGAGVRQKAASALGELGWADEAAPILLALARDEGVEAGVRQKAASALGELGWADEAAPILLALARDEGVHGWVRWIAVSTLGELGRADDLLALARDEGVDAGVRWIAGSALGKLGRAAATPEAMEGLCALTEDMVTPEEVRRAARRALQRLEGQER